MKSDANLALYDDLRLIEVGMELFLQIKFANGKTVQTRSSMIGFHTGHFVLIAYPTKDFSEAYQHMLSNAEIIVRAMSNSGYKDIIAFKSSILSLVNQPTRMLSLSIPKAITKKKVRDQLRVKAEQQVFLIRKEAELMAKMVDFSFSGCLLSLDEKTEGIEVDENIKISISINAEISGVLAGTVVKAQAGNGELSLGIKFTDEQSELKEQIFGYLLVIANKQS